YVPAVAVLPFAPGVELTSLDLLPGALERNMAIVGHVAFTYIVLHAITRGKGLLLLAMGLHFALNAVAVSTVLLTGNIWLAELALAGMVVVILGLATWVSRGWSVPPVESGTGPATDEAPGG
ncbi:MAG: hypothetical protein R3291_02930, partial [Thermoplasmata archaeon]|nr:hypothetical protein [Thermoplasmata archaeon]